jgi:hypothetical protein
MLIETIAAFGDTVLRWINGGSGALRAATGGTRRIGFREGAYVKVIGIP